MGRMSNWGNTSPNNPLHPTAAAFGFSEFNVSQAAAAGELLRSLIILV